jgi:hypothetical protein
VRLWQSRFAAESASRHLPGTLRCWRCWAAAAHEIPPPCPSLHLQVEPWPNSNLRPSHVSCAAKSKPIQRGPSATWIEPFPLQLLAENYPHTPATAAFICVSCAFYHCDWVDSLW